MGTSNEPAPSESRGSPPPLADGSKPPRVAPTPAAVLRWVAAAGGHPWFPSQYAAAEGIDRDALDEPLARLRLAGLVRVVTWVRGVGQGYELTPAGQAAARRTSIAIPATSDSGPASLTELERPLAAVSDYRPPPPLWIEHRRPLVVPALLVANLLWFLVGLVVAVANGVPVWSYLSGTNIELLHQLGGVTGIDLLQGQWWRLLSSCFVHAGGLHLFVNLLALWMMGPLAELFWGRVRLLVIYLMSGLGGSCLAMALRPDVMLIGASGAIWGVMLSLVAWFVLFRQHLRPEVASESIRRLLILIVLNAGFSFLPGISWAGHLGGGVVGFVTAGLLNASRFADRSRRRFALVLLVALPVLCIGGLLRAMQSGDEWIALQQRQAAEQERAARAERIRALVQALAEYNQQVVPHLNQLLPEQVERVERQARVQLLFPAKYRSPEPMAEVRDRLMAMKSAADEAIRQLSGPPTGVDAVDQLRERAKRYAEARARSFELLLGMLAADVVPNQAAWDAWGKERRTARELGGGVVRE